MKKLGVLIFLLMVSASSQARDFEGAMRCTVLAPKPVVFICEPWNAVARNRTFLSTG